MEPQIIEKNSTPLRNEVPFCIKYSMNKVDLKFLQNYCHVTAYTIPKRVIIPYSHKASQQKIASEGLLSFQVSF